MNTKKIKILHLPSRLMFWHVMLFTDSRDSVRLLPLDSGANTKSESRGENSMVDTRYHWLSLGTVCEKRANEL